MFALKAHIRTGHSHCALGTRALEQLTSKPGMFLKANERLATGLWPSPAAALRRGSVSGTRWQAGPSALRAGKRHEPAQASARLRSTREQKSPSAEANMVVPLLRLQPRPAAPATGPGFHPAKTGGGGWLQRAADSPYAPARRWSKGLRARPARGDAA